MKYRTIILSIAWLVASFRTGAQNQQNISFDFYGDTIGFITTLENQLGTCDSVTRKSVDTFYQRISATDYKPVIAALEAYKSKYNPDDWVFYQLIRRTAESLSPKAINYNRYTLFKWFLMCKCGYDATLNRTENKLLLYVQSDDDIYDIPYFMRDGKRYICLNYHDYGYRIEFTEKNTHNVAIAVAGAINKFSYKLSQLPNFRPEDYHDKDLSFDYHHVSYHFKVKMTDDVKKMFVNYPVADYRLYFNEPLSCETYNSLIPQLKNNMRKMSVKQGVDYLMHFTRYAFLYQPDQENFGREKHLSPEQTLLYDRSDCEDRAALFYCLVKEIYNLPMIVLLYPHHLTVAVKFDKPEGAPIVYNGSTYSVCEPTPQTEDLPLGGIVNDLRAVPFEIAYVYDPVRK